MTRPDIEERINSASVLQTVDPGTTYAKLAKILRYIPNVRGIFLSRAKDNEERKGRFEVSVWPDASLRACVKTGKSRTGYIVRLGGDPVAWLSKRQSRVALSSNDAEIFAAAEAVREGLAVRHIQEEHALTPGKAISVFEDNAQTILAAERGMSGQRTKHIPLEYHWLSELQDLSEIKFRKVGTRGQIADVLTKALPRDQHISLIDQFTVKVPGTIITGS